MKQRQLTYLRACYRFYMKWLQGEIHSDVDNVSYVSAIVRMIQNALLHMEEENRKIMVSYFFMQQDSTCQHRNTWKRLNKVQKIEAMCAFFRCLND